jgi:glycerate kinase
MNSKEHLHPTPLKVVIAPNAFKDSLTAEEACQAMERGVLSAAPHAHVQLCPLADGGDGLLSAVIHTTEGSTHRLAVEGPLGQTIEATYGLTQNGMGIVEMALASGLASIPYQERTPKNALQASSHGTGQVVRHLIEKGCKHILLGIGGSATTDGGTGFAKALGYRFLDKQGQELPPGGGHLTQLERIEEPASPFKEALETCRFQVACDVNNPLLGAEGSAAVFAPQKGADAQAVEQLEQGLTQLAKVAVRDFSNDCSAFPGAGAAGGIGFWLKAFCQAELLPGAELMIQQSGLASHLQEANLLLTAEGALDAQSAHGKLPAQVAALGQQYGIPTIAFAGKLGAGWEQLKSKGLTAGFAIASGPCTLEESIQQGATLLENATQDVLATFLAGRTSHSRS